MSTTLVPPLAPSPHRFLLIVLAVRIRGNYRTAQALGVCSVLRVLDVERAAFSGGQAQAEQHKERDDASSVAGVEP